MIFLFIIYSIYNMRLLIRYVKKILILNITEAIVGEFYVYTFIADTWPSLTLNTISLCQIHRENHVTCQVTLNCQSSRMALPMVQSGTQ